MSESRPTSRSGLDFLPTDAEIVQEVRLRAIETDDRWLKRVCFLAEQRLLTPEEINAAPQVSTAGVDAGAGRDVGPLPAVAAPQSEKQGPITDNDRRWRFLEHGCQWVSFTPTGGDTRSFDPRIVSGYAGHLGDMRATVDREAEKQLAILKEGINAAKR